MLSIKILYTFYLHLLKKIRTRWSRWRQAGRRWLEEYRL